MSGISVHMVAGVWNEEGAEAADSSASSARSSPELFATLFWLVRLCSAILSVGDWDPASIEQSYFSQREKVFGT